MHPETSRDSGQHRRTGRTTEAPGAHPVGRYMWEQALRDSADITGMTLAVALLVSTYANSDGSSIRPAVYTLGHQLGLAVSDDNRCRPVSKHLARLVELRWLERTARGSAGRPATYRLTTPDRAPTITVATSDRDPTSTVTTPDRAHRSTEPCSQEPANRAPTSTRPTHDQIKTDLSPPEEAPAVMIDPEQIREERARELSHHDSSSASGAELVQVIAANDGADPAKWSPERQERVKDRVARHPALGGTAVPLVRPLLLELASRAGSIKAPVDAYVSGILSGPTGPDDVRRLAEAGQRRIPKPPKPAAIDRLNSRERERLLEDVAAELIERGDVMPDWQHDSDRDRFERIIRHHANQRAQRRHPVSA